jgi:putative transcriptional regulator
MHEPTYLSNHLLIAMPGLADPNFARGVTLICKHDAEGALGIMINRLSELTVGEVLDQVGLPEHDPGLGAQPVYLGGPVQTDRGFVLHEPGGGFEWSYPISPLLTMTTSRDILVAMAEGRGPRPALVAIGYAGWGAGQLEEEIRQNAWLSVPAERSILFDTPIEQRWQAAAQLAGIDVRLLTDYAGHA